MQKMETVGAQTSDLPHLNLSQSSPSPTAIAAPNQQDQDGKDQLDHHQQLLTSNPTRQTDTNDMQREEKTQEGDIGEQEVPTTKQNENNTQDSPTNHHANHNLNQQNKGFELLSVESITNASDQQMQQRRKRGGRDNKDLELSNSKLTIDRHKEGSGSPQAKLAQPTKVITNIISRRCENPSQIGVSIDAGVTNAKNPSSNKNVNNDSFMQQRGSSQYKVKKKSGRRMATNLFMTEFFAPREGPVNYINDMRSAQKNSSAHDLQRVPSHHIAIKMGQNKHFKSPMPQAINMEEASSNASGGLIYAKNTSQNVSKKNLPQDQYQQQANMVALGGAGNDQRLKDSQTDLLLSIQQDQQSLFPNLDQKYISVHDLQPLLLQTARNSQTTNNRHLTNKNHSYKQTKKAIVNLQLQLNGDFGGGGNNSVVGGRNSQLQSSQDRNGPPDFNNAFSINSESDLIQNLPTNLQTSHSIIQQHHYVTAGARQIYDGEEGDDLNQDEFIESERNFNSQRHQGGERQLQQLDQNYNIASDEYHRENSVYSVSHFDAEHYLQNPNKGAVTTFHNTLEQVRQYHTTIEQFTLGLISKQQMHDEATRVALLDLHEKRKLDNLLAIKGKNSKMNKNQNGSNEDASKMLERGGVFSSGSEAFKDTNVASHDFETDQFELKGFSRRGKSQKRLLGSNSKAQNLQSNNQIHVNSKLTPLQRQREVSVDALKETYREFKQAKESAAQLNKHVWAASNNSLARQNFVSQVNQKKQRLRDQSVELLERSKVGVSGVTRQNRHSFFQTHDRSKLLRESQREQRGKVVSIQRFSESKQQNHNLYEKAQHSLDQLTQNAKMGDRKAFVSQQNLKAQNTTELLIQNQQKQKQGMTNKFSLLQTAQDSSAVQNSQKTENRTSKMNQSILFQDHNSGSMQTNSKFKNETQHKEASLDLQKQNSAASKTLNEGEVLIKKTVDQMLMEITDSSNNMALINQASQFVTGFGSRQNHQLQTISDFENLNQTRLGGQVIVANADDTSEFLETQRENSQAAGEKSTISANKFAFGIQNLNQQSQFLMFGTNGGQNSKLKDLDDSQDNKSDNLTFFNQSFNQTKMSLNQASGQRQENVSRNISKTSNLQNLNVNSERVTPQKTADNKLEIREQKAKAKVSQRLFDKQMISKVEDIIMNKLQKEAQNEQKGSSPDLKEKKKLEKSQKLLAKRQASIESQRDNMKAGTFKTDEEIQEEQLRLLERAKLRSMGEEGFKSLVKEQKPKFQVETNLNQTLIDFLDKTDQAKYNQSLIKKTPTSSIMDYDLNRNDYVGDEETETRGENAIFTAADDQMTGIHLLKQSHSSIKNSLSPRNHNDRSDLTLKFADHDIVYDQKNQGIKSGNMTIGSENFTRINQNSSKKALLNQKSGSELIDPELVKVYERVGNSTRAKGSLPMPTKFDRNKNVKSILAQQIAANKQKEEQERLLRKQIDFAQKAREMGSNILMAPRVSKRSTKTLTKKDSVFFDKESINAPEAANGVNSLEKQQNQVKVEKQASPFGEKHLPYTAQSSQVLVSPISKKQSTANVVGGNLKGKSMIRLPSKVQRKLSSLNNVLIKEQNLAKMKQNMNWFDREAFKERQIAKRRLKAIAEDRSDWDESQYCQSDYEEQQIRRQMKSTADFHYKQSSGGREQARKALAALNPRFEDFDNSSVSEESSDQDFDFEDDMFKQYKIRRQVVNGITMAASEEEIMKQAARQFMIIKRKQMMNRLIMQGRCEFVMNDQKIRNMIKEISLETIYFDLMAMCERFDKERQGGTGMQKSSPTNKVSDMDLLQATTDQINEELQRAQEESKISTHPMTGEELQSRVMMDELASEYNQLHQMESAGLSRGIMTKFQAEKTISVSKFEKQFLSLLSKPTHDESSIFKTEGGSNSNSEQFRNLVHQEAQRPKLAREQLLRKLKYIEIFKKAFNASFAGQMPQDPQFQYFAECTRQINEALPILDKIQNKSLNIALPILDKIQNKTLCLHEYTLDIGQCRALAKVCQFLDHGTINRVLFDNCGIDDKEFAAILEGLNNLEDFKSITYKRNVFDQDSLEAIKPILQKRNFPHHLEELQIIDCKINSIITDQLVQAFHHPKCNLQKISLVNTRMSQATFTNLIDFFKRSTMLEKIDLTWCEVNAVQWIPFFDFLQSNRKVQYLTLSYNAIFSKMDLEEEQNGADWDELEEQRRTMLLKLTHFIKRNKSLVHVDLTSTNLSDQGLHVIGNCLRRAQALRSIHLCENPGIKPGTAQKMAQLAHGLLPDPVPILNNDEEEDTFTFELQKGDEKTLDQAELMTNSIKNKRATERQVTRPVYVNLHGTEKKLIMARKPGLKMLIPGAGQWHALTQPAQDCWVCGQHMLAVFFWSKTIGEQVQVVDFMQEEFYEEKIEEMEEEALENPENKPRKAFTKVLDAFINDLLQIEADEQSCDPDDFPQIYGQFTHWQGFKMLPIKQFEIIARTNPMKLIQDMKKEGILKENIYRYYQLSAKEKQIFMQKLQSQLPKTDEDGDTWQEILMQTIPFLKPILVNGEIVHNLYPADPYAYKYAEPPKDLHVFLEIVKPGKHFYTVKYNDTHYLHRSVFRHRDEPMPKYTKLSYKTKVHEFNWSSSIFGSWKGEEDDFPERCYENDCKLWRLRRIIRDTTDLQKSEQFMKQNYSMVRNMFDYFKYLGGQTIGIGYNEMRRLANQMNILQDSLLLHKSEKENRNKKGQDLSFNDIDRFFYSTIMSRWQEEKEKSTAPVEPLKPKSEESHLTRADFIEILMRVANFRYKEPGQVKTFEEAIISFYNNDLLPFYRDVTRIWTGFRRKDLWTSDCHSLYSANTVSLQKLFQKYVQRQTLKKKNLRKGHETTPFLIVEDVVKMVCEDSDLKFDQQMVCQIFGMSKMSVIQDSEDKGQQQLQRMVFVEFLDFIGRLAVIKFNGTELNNLGLVQKIGHVLDDLLAIVSEQRVDALEEEIEESESDDDY